MEPGFQLLWKSWYYARPKCFALLTRRKALTAVYEILTIQRDYGKSVEISTAKYTVDKFVLKGIERIGE